MTVWMIGITCTIAAITCELLGLPYFTGLFAGAALVLIPASYVIEE